MSNTDQNLVSDVRNYLFRSAQRLMEFQNTLGSERANALLNVAMNLIDEEGDQIRQDVIEYSVLDALEIIEWSPSEQNRVAIGDYEYVWVDGKWGAWGVAPMMSERLPLNEVY